MNEIQFKDCRKAVNKAVYSATAQRKAEALKLLKELTMAIQNLEEVVPTERTRYATEQKAKPSVLAKKVRRTKGRMDSNSRLERKMQRESFANRDKRTAHSEPSRKVERVNDVPTKERPFGSRKEVLTPKESYKAPREELTLRVREGETPAMAYRRMKSARLEEAKRQAMADFEDSLESVTPIFEEDNAPF